MSQLTYESYLDLPKLLDLQRPRSEPPEHDEMLFIIIHQAYELWFKLMLHEFSKIKRDFSGNDVYSAMHTFKRCRTIMKTLVEQLDVIETMTPMSFQSFRERLDTASGFQSVQFREVEFELGYRRPEMLKYHPEGSPARALLERRLSERSLIDHLYDLLGQNGVSVPRELLERDVRESNVPNETVQDGLFELYHREPSVANLLELMTDFDEGFQEWRYRHVMLVMRTIGEKHGTGGSLGVEFLKRSLFQPVFADLWAIRHRF